MQQTEISQIESKLQYTFANKQLLVQAFTHSSYANAENVADNERMEFFGDAILEYIATERLYHLYPKCDAGQLSKLRAVVVSASGLKPSIQKLDLLQHLRVANGAGKIKKLSKKIEANLFEAILCAIYFDGGMQPAKDFVLRELDESMQNVAKIVSSDYKTRLQEYCQRTKHTVRYQLDERSGPDNDPVFRYKLFIDETVVSIGEGRSIKAAEQDAAKKIVTDWRID